MEAKVPERENWCLRLAGICRTNQVAILLCAGVDQVVKVMAGDREYRRPVQPRIIQPVQQMQPTRSGSD